MHAILAGSTEGKNLPRAMGTSLQLRIKLRFNTCPLRVAWQLPSSHGSISGDTHRAAQQMVGSNTLENESKSHLLKEKTGRGSMERREPGREGAIEGGVSRGGDSLDPV